MFKKHPVLTVATGILLLLILAFVITGAFVLHAAKGKSGEFEYLVILGTKVEGTMPSPMLQDRIDAAYDYLHANPEVICVPTGYRGADAQISEAECIRRGLIARGIDESRIWVEENATSTEENFALSLALIEEKSGSRPASIGVLSSEYHLFRAGIFAADQSIDIATVPAKTSDPVDFVRSLLREIPLIWYYATIG